MSKLVNHRVWVRRHFEPGSGPTKEKIIKSIESKSLPGTIVAGDPYIYSDALDKLTASTKPQQSSSVFDGSKYFTA